ncbi:hypothetical protein GmHk_08G023869 [Glycine max]|nr:hypothetical protein GmHk_08G023869 [Glycine max]
MYDNIISEEVDMNEQNQDEAGVNKEYVDCCDAFNTSQVFATRDDVLHWAQSVAYKIGFVAVIMRSDTNSDIRGRTSSVLIDCEISDQYRVKKKDLVRTVIGSRKYGCPFKLCAETVVGGERWMVKLMCGSHNHELIKSLVGHPYVYLVTKDEKIIVVNMIMSMVKLKNIFLTLKKYNVNSYTTIKQIYNARNVYCCSIRDNNTIMQQLMKFLERDQLKDEDVVRDTFWSHSDAVKLTNACNLICLIDSTYKTNRYRLLLLDIVGVTPIGMTFFVAFAYLEGEPLQQFRGLFLRRDALHRIIVTDRDLRMMNVVKTVFLEANNLLC